MSDDSVSDLSSASTPSSRSTSEGSTSEGSSADESGADATSPSSTTKHSRENANAANPANPAISDDTVQRYYYIYDSRAGRPLVQDRLTQAPYAWDDDPRAPILRYVASRGSGQEKPSADNGGEGSANAVERRFAWWCARQVTDAMRSKAKGGDEPSSTVSMADTLVQAAKGLIDTPASKQVDSIRGTAENSVIHASTIGLSEMDPSAAALLTAFGATHPDPRTAALEAAHMSERYAEFVAYHQRNGADTLLPAAVRRRYDRLPGARDDTPVPDAAARLMREAHIDWLLDEA